MGRLWPSDNDAESEEVPSYEDSDFGRRCCSARGEDSRHAEDADREKYSDEEELETDEEEEEDMGEALKK